MITPTWAGLCPQPRRNTHHRPPRRVEPHREPRRDQQPERLPSRLRRAHLRRRIPRPPRQRPRRIRVTRLIRVDRIHRRTRIHRPPLHRNRRRHIRPTHTHTNAILRQPGQLARRPGQTRRPTRRPTRASRTLNVVDRNSVPVNAHLHEVAARLQIRDRCYARSTHSRQNEHRTRYTGRPRAPGRQHLKSAGGRDTEVTTHEPSILPSPTPPGWTGAKVLSTPGITHLELSTHAQTSADSPSTVTVTF